ncbi:MAG: serine/threonine protein kinase [Gemmatimonadetes bacterium]|nr:serine/threonine protein kinase [Gemmatimonadota bacterium]MBK9067079.1 serine/threonine protein kinase [Gemmatimonadota bacterium]
MTQPSREFLDFQAAVAGEYSLERELGRGGMGIVYLARDVHLDRDVAIKVLPAQLAESGAFRERFLREARTAAGLSHPHIVPIHQVGERGGFVFFVMSYVEGETLGERLRTRGPLPPAEAARVLREVAWALAYAHGRGIVHRDVKPDNILLEAGTGRALVSDFGIASGGGAAGPDTDPGRRMGTAHFMSPEQAAGLPVDGRSDLYGLGVVGYLAVSGRLPFESATLPALLVRQAGAAAPGVAAQAPGLPPSLAQAIDQCLARDPDARPADGEALAAALAPAPETRPALPPTLRAWLGARNPLLVPYLGWAGMFGTLTLANLIAWVTGNRPDGPADIVFLAAIAAAPLLPVVGYHLNQARRQFRAGHTLADLRAALEVARRERAEREAVSREAEEPVGHRLLRAATVASATWGAVTLGLLLAEVVHERTMGARWIVLPLLSTLLFSAVSNALDVQFIPDRLRRWWQTGVRERLWHSRVGEWLARRLGAPERSRAVGGGVFRATEVALGVAASELFAALPAATRAQLAGLPATVAALEARAQEARAELEQLAARARAGDAAVLAARQRAAQAYLADSVAALEGVRLDLLRLHANASDLAPLTTLLEAARQLGEEAGRLADAQREVDDATRR